MHFFGRGRISGPIRGAAAAARLVPPPTSRHLGCVRAPLGAASRNLLPLDIRARGSALTPFCDVVLRFESLKRDFDGLMAKVGCPLRLPEQRKKARGNRLVPLLADDVVASVRRMYADDYSLVKRLAGLGLDDLLANATSA